MVFTGFQKSPTELVEYLKDKKPELHYDYDELMHEAHHRTFTVAKVTRLDLLKDIQDSLKNAMDKLLDAKLTREEFKNYQERAVVDLKQEVNRLLNADGDKVCIFKSPTGSGKTLMMAEFLKRLRALCDQHGILIIADEVQTGFARTGKLFAMDHYETKADLITMAKSLGGGFPISGVVGRAEVMDAPNPGGLGGTYAGNPVAVASAHAVLDVIAEEGLCERANVLGAELVEVLNELKQSSSTVQEIRALGSMVAIELETADQAKAIQNYAMQNGLLILTCGRYGNVIRFLYPLTIPAEQFRAGLNILKQGFALSAAA